MIVLGRSKGQTVIVGDALYMTVVEIEADRTLVSVSRRIASGRMTFFEAISSQWLGVEETIQLGNAISCVVRDIRGDKIRLGFTLPPTVTVHRKEVYEAILAQKLDDGTPS